MDKKITEIFNEVLERFYWAESSCIQEYNCGKEDEYDNDDLDKDIKDYKTSFERALNGE